MPSSPRALWRRLRAMDGAELRERVRQELDKRIDRARCLAGAAPKPEFVQKEFAEPGLTAKNAKSAKKFFFDARELAEIAASLGKRFPKQVDETVARAEKICAHRFDLLGYEDLDYGPTIDWHLDRVHGKRAPKKPWYKIRYLDFGEVGDVKVTWELNRHQHLVTLAKACLFTRNERFAKELFTQWYSWREQNPYPTGVNWASSLEVAFRAISWLWMRELLAGCSVTPASFQDDLRHVLWLSGRHIERYLSTYFSPNTHLLGEGVGLFFLGVLCPELSEAARWQERGWKIIVEEAKHQVRADGLHFEQATYYHVYALDLFLHAAILAQRNGIEVPPGLERTIEKMLEALLLTSQAGVAPRFGDDDGGRLFDPRRNRTEHMLDPLATGAILFERGDFKAAAGELREETVWLLGMDGVSRFDRLPASEPKAQSSAFRESGLYVMAAESNDGPAQLVIDAGAQGVIGGGHGHADALGLQLAQAGRPLLIDPGTFEYVGPDGKRDLFRGTAAHSTVQIDGRDQAKPKGPFSWETLISPSVRRWETSENFDLFEGSYEVDGLVHQRSVFYCKPEFWLVRDVVEGNGKHGIKAHWHLAPGMKQQMKDPAFFLSGDGKAGIAIVGAAESKCRGSLQDGLWSPVYGCKTTAPILQIEMEAMLPSEMAVVLAPAAHGQKLGQLRRSPSDASPQVSGYVYCAGDITHRMFFAEGRGSWTLEDWSSDAEFLYCREDSSGIGLLAFCNGSHVAFGGEVLVSATKAIDSCELVAAERRTICKERDAITVHRWPEGKGQFSASGMETVAAKVEN